MTFSDIRYLTPLLQRVFFNFQAWAKRVIHRDIILVCTYRDCAEQNILYHKGRLTPGPIVTNIDGINEKSKHNYSPAEGGARAFDFAFLVKGKPVWKEEWYDSCWLFFRQAKLTKKVRWGRDWKNFKDKPHIEEV